MLLELAKPVALLLCLLSLYALFHAAFMVPGSTYLLVPGPGLHDKIFDSLQLLGLSAAICLISGGIFREAAPRPQPSLLVTLPLQVFYWAASTMLLLFLASWYLETYCIFYRDTCLW
jgi:hypothetical protein